LLCVCRARNIVDPSWTYVIADLEFYPGDSKPLDSAEGNDALREAVSDWIDENEEYIYIEQVTPASLFGTAL
jgi:hypothetical protein